VITIPISPSNVVSAFDAEFLALPDFSLEANLKATKDAKLAKKFLERLIDKLTDCLHTIQ
jgi:hypothetical protein